MTVDFEVKSPNQKKENPEVNTREYRKLEKSLERLDEQQKVSYLKKRLTNHICSIYIEQHPELGLVADDDPKMVSELQRRIHRIYQILDDSPIYSPFLRGLKTNEYKDTNWATRQSLARPFIHDIRIMSKIVDGYAIREGTIIPEIVVSDMIYEAEQKKNKKLVPEVHVLRGLHCLSKIQRIDSVKYASDKDLSKLRANHGNYRNALKHIAVGILSGGLSMFSVITFGAVFDRYIQNYRIWLGIELSAIRFSGRMEVIKLQRKVHRQIEALKNLRKNNKNIPLLRRMYGWFPDEYRYQRIRIADIKAALKNKERGNEIKKIKGIKSRQLITVYLYLTLFIAGSPLARLGLLLNDNISSIDNEMVLKKRQIQSAQMMNNYYKVSGLEGDSKKGPVNTLKMLENIVDFCQDTIKRYVSKTGSLALENPHERDPFIKAYTALRMFLADFSEDKTARSLLHRFYPSAQQLLRGSAKKNHISVAHTIVNEIEASIREYGKSDSRSRRNMARAG